VGLFEPDGEGVQVGLVVGLDCGDPGVQAVTMKPGKDLCELGDVAGQGAQVGAAGS
jgi:hypothetical protein